MSFMSFMSTNAVNTSFISVNPSQHGSESVSPSVSASTGFKDLVQDESSLSKSDRKKITRIFDLYKTELNRPKSVDLGVKGDKRAALRNMCKKSLLEVSKVARRNRSNSNYSGTGSLSEDRRTGNALTDLKRLQKERLSLSRMGFLDKAMLLDKEIETVRKQAAQLRIEEEAALLEVELQTLSRKHTRKSDRFEAVLAAEYEARKQEIAEKRVKMIARHEQEFFAILQNAERKARGKAKQCTCPSEYLCRHNKSSSSNTRKSIPKVVMYRRAVKRLKEAGRNEDALEIQDKANELDQEHQESWRENIAASVVESPWGADVTKVDRIIEVQKKELEVFESTARCSMEEIEAVHQRKRWALKNNMSAEENRVRIKVKKQYEQELQDRYKQQELMDSNVSALNNLSSNLLNDLNNDNELDNMEATPKVFVTGKQRSLSFGVTKLDTTETAWVPPTTTGLDNSAAIVESVGNTVKQPPRKSLSFGAQPIHMDDFQAGTAFSPSFPSISHPAYTAFNTNYNQNTGTLASAGVSVDDRYKHLNNQQHESLQYNSIGNRQPQSNAFPNASPIMDNSFNGAAFNGQSPSHAAFAQSYVSHASAPQSPQFASNSFGRNLSPTAPTTPATTTTTAPPRRAGSFNAISPTALSQSTLNNDNTITKNNTSSNTAIVSPSDGNESSNTGSKASSRRSNGVSFALPDDADYVPSSVSTFNPSPPINKSGSSGQSPAANRKIVSYDAASSQEDLVDVQDTVNRFLMAFQRGRG